MRRREPSEDPSSVQENFENNALPSSTSRIFSDVGTTGKPPGLITALNNPARKVWRRNTAVLVLQKL